MQGQTWKKAILSQDLPKRWHSASPNPPRGQEVSYGLGDTSDFQVVKLANCTICLTIRSDRDHKGLHCLWCSCQVIHRTLTLTIACYVCNYYNFICRGIFCTEDREKENQVSWNWSGVGVDLPQENQQLTHTLHIIYTDIHTHRSTSKREEKMEKTPIASLRVCIINCVNSESSFRYWHPNKVSIPWI